MVLYGKFSLKRLKFLLYFDNITNLVHQTRERGFEFLMANVSVPAFCTVEEMRDVEFFTTFTGHFVNSRPSRKLKSRPSPNYNLVSQKRYFLSVRKISHLEAPFGEASSDSLFSGDSMLLSDNLAWFFLALFGQCLYPLEEDSIQTQPG